MPDSANVVEAGHASNATRQADRPSQGRTWHWPPRPFTLVVVGLVLAFAFLANFPAVEVPHPDLRDATFGQHFNLLTEYEHGWPLRYSRRDLSHRTSAQGPPSAWRPWEGPGRWRTVNLLVDLALWSLVVVGAGVAAQWWRAQRRAVWQLGLRDLLILTGVAGIAFAWLADQRAEYLRERALVETLRMRPGKAVLGHQFGARVPAYWPPSWQARYRQLFDRPCYFHSSGDSDLACQHRHIVALHEITFHPDFPSHLRQMQGLEAIDLCFVKLPYFDATRQATILRDLAPLPCLRGINLEKTNVTDADMAWLASCSRLEVINLSQTSIGDHGLAQLAGLPHLRWLKISSDRISDRGCKSIGEMSALEELSIASRNVRDAGVAELAKLRTLHSLEINASASGDVFAALRRGLPQCKVKSHGYSR
jgi:Leucine rich repeat